MLCVWKMGDRKLNYIKQEIVNSRGQEAVRPVAVPSIGSLEALDLRTNHSHDFRVHRFPPAQPALPRHGRCAAQLAVNIYRMIPTIPSTFPT